MTFQHILFDLDGTLTDSEEGIRNAFVHALRKMGIDRADPDTLKKMIGPPLHYSFPTFFGMSEQETEDAVRFFREYYTAKGVFENRPYEGIPELLKELHGKGAACYIATTKVHAQAVRVAEHFGLAPYLKDIVGSRPEEKESRKDALILSILSRNGITDREEVLMVGDRRYDIEGAKRAGIRSAGVLYGYGTGEELKEAGADYIFPDVRSLGCFLLS